MYIKNYRELPVEQTEVEGLTFRWGINKDQGAVNFSGAFLVDRAGHADQTDVLPACAPSDDSHACCPPS